MLKVLEYSITHFCEHILNFKLENAEGIKGEYYGSSIPILKKDGTEYIFYLFFSEKTLGKFAEVLLSDGKFKEDDWCDLSKECANQIIGYAKNLLNDAQGDKEYTLGIPEYLGRIDFSNIVLDEFLVYKLDGECFKVGYKKA